MAENTGPELAVDDREVQAQAERVNQLLRQLEQQLDDNQHAQVTELLAERAVLAAMRARVELDEAQGRLSGTASTGPDGASTGGFSTLTSGSSFITPGTEKLPDQTEADKPKGESTL